MRENKTNRASRAQGCRNKSAQKSLKKNKNKQKRKKKNEGEGDPKEKLERQLKAQLGAGQGGP